MNGKKFDFILKNSGLSKREFAKLAGISRQSLVRECEAVIVKAVYVALLTKVCTPPQFNELSELFDRQQEERLSQNEGDENDES